MRAAAAVSAKARRFARGRLAAAWLCAAWRLLGGPVYAQERLFSLEVNAGERADAACFQAAALSQRIAEFIPRGVTPAKRTRVVLDVVDETIVQVRVLIGGELSSRRRFSHLPDKCVDRRDAVALATAMAIEDGAVRMSARAKATSSRGAAAHEPRRPPAARSGDVAVAAADSNAAPQPSAAVPGELVAASSDSSLEAGRVDAEPMTGSRGGSDVAIARSSAQNAEQSLRSRASTAPEQPMARDTSVPRSQTYSVARPSGLGLDLYLGPRWLTGALPEPTFAGSIGMGLWLSPSFVVDASALLSAVTASELVNTQVRTRLVGGQLLGCGQVHLGHATFQGCAGLNAAACHVESDVNSTRASVLWSAALLRVALRWPNDNVISVRLVAQAHVNLVRPGIRVESPSAQIYPGRLGAELGFDVMFALF